MYHCIFNSLTDSYHTNIVVESHKYIMKGKMVGELLFKQLIKKSVTDPRYTQSHIRENLTKIEAYFSIVNSNIHTLNQNMKVNMEWLIPRGEITDDIVTNLFKDYHVASNAEYVRYIMTNKDIYGDGKYITPEKLITEQLNKHEVILTSVIFNTMHPEQYQVIALTPVVKN